MIRIPVKSLFQISHLHLLQFQFEGLLEYGNQEILDRLSQPGTLMNCVDTIFWGAVWRKINSETNYSFPVLYHYKSACVQIIRELFLLHAT